MPSRELYLLASEFKRTKVCRKLSGADFFAVAMPDGTISYVKMQELFARQPRLIVLPGDASLDAHRAEFWKDADRTAAAITESLFQGDEIICDFAGKANLEEADLKEIEGHGLVFRGRNAFPIFRRKRPYYLDARLTDAGDEARLRLCLEAALDVARALTPPTSLSGYAVRRFLDDRLEELGFAQEEPFDREVPLLTPGPDGAFSWGRHPLPEYVPPTYDSLVLDDGLLDSLRRKKRSGVWECGVFLSPLSTVLVDDDDVEIPTGGNATSVPYHPHALMIVDHADGSVLRSEEIDNPDHYWSDLLDIFIESLLTIAVPREIYVSDERTRRLIMGIAGQ